MGMSSNYKQEKESFVSGSNGGTIGNINSVCLTALTTYALWTTLTPILGTSRSTSLKTPILESLILVLPLLLSLTLFSSHPLYFNSFLSLLTLFLHLNPPSQSHSLLPPPSPSIPKKDAPPPPNPTTTTTPTRMFAKPFVTVYRAHMMLMTVICILAVDFKIFPREFAKAETWGTSLMDIGVGSFVFSLGVVSALPILRDAKRTPFLISLWTSTKKSAGVLALGLIRVLMVKGVDYPEHVSEYGVHWNFFFTMGLLPVFGAALEPLAPYFDFTWMAIIISSIHQLALDRTMLQFWTLTAQRTSLLSQNKEGLVSLPGYLSIYLLGLSSGLYILPPDPYYFSHLRPSKSGLSKENEKKLEKARRDKPGKTASVLGSYAVVWCAAYAGLKWGGWEVSRRLANLPYVIWITAFNTSFLLCYLLIHSWATSINPSLASSPAIFDAVNKNGLVVFLVANLLTGLVNVSIQSMYASDTVALGVMGMYLAGVIGTAWALRHRRLRM